MGLPKEMGERQRRSILAGNGAMFGGKVYTKKDMAPEDYALALVGAEGVENAEAEARLMLAEDLDTAKARILELESASPDQAMLERAAKAEKERDEALKRLTTAQERVSAVDTTIGENTRLITDLRKRLDAAEKALKPFQDRNGQQAKLLDALIPTDEAGLKGLKVGQLRQIAAFRGIDLPKEAREDELVGAIQVPSPQGG